MFGMPTKYPTTPEFLPEWKSLARLAPFLDSATTLGLLSREEEFAYSREIEEGNLAHYALCIRHGRGVARTIAEEFANQYAIDRTTWLLGQKEVSSHTKNAVEQTQEYNDRIHTFSTDHAYSSNDLLQLVRRGAQAKGHLVERNVKLLIKPAQRYARPLWPVEDLVQEGFDMLDEAAYKFHHGKGYRFASFAIPHLYKRYSSLSREKRFNEPQMIYGQDDFKDTREDSDPLDMLIAKNNLQKMIQVLAATMTTKEIYAIIAKFGVVGGPPIETQQIAREIGVPYRDMERIRTSARRKMAEIAKGEDFRQALA